MQSLSNDGISWKGPMEWGGVIIFNLHKPSTLGGFCTKHQTWPSNALILTKEHQGREDLMAKSPFVQAESVPKPRMPQSWPSPSMEKATEAKRKVPEELVVRVTCCLIYSCQQKLKLCKRLQNPWSGSEAQSHSEREAAGGAMQNLHYPTTRGIREKKAVP